MDRSLSTELALKAFDADAAFNAALAEFQQGPPKDSFWDEVGRSAGHGFSWFARPSEPGPWEVILRHKAGSETNAKGTSPYALLMGLLGLVRGQDIAAPVATQAAEPEQEKITVGEVQALADALAGVRVTRFSPAQVEAAVSAVLDPRPTGCAMAAASLTAAVGERLTAAIDALPPSAAQVAAESLAAATGGEVVMDPEDVEQMRLAEPLTAEQKRACVDGINLLPSDKMRAFKISFRDAFKVPREAKSIAPLITEVRHMEFCDRWSIEAGGGVAA